LTPASRWRRPARNRANRGCPPDLRHVDAARLLALAAAGRPSHELAAGYRAEAARPVRDIDLILALQWLAANGDLVRLR
jgi:hypothetical protein